jgi:hypothetical protein
VRARAYVCVWGGGHKNEYEVPKHLHCIVSLSVDIFKKRRRPMLTDFLVITERSIECHSPWPVSARELYRPTDRRLSAKLVPTFTDRGCHVVSVTDPFVVFSVF